MKFELTSPYKPTGDQPQAIQQLVDGINDGTTAQVLLGVTGSGKTYTMANVIAQANKPTLILSHNKTLAAQLYEEMRGFFPHNAVEYYVSYYDYYQPEAYLPTTDVYIEKDLAINDEIDKLRLRAVSALLSGRKDVVVVSSVSCIYGMGGPTAMANSVIAISIGQKLDRNQFLRKLVDALYIRNDIDLQRGNFRVKGDTVDIEYDTLHPDQGQITALIPRRNGFARWNQKTRSPQLLAANIDLLLCVTTPANPPFRPRFTDRTLVQAAAEDIPTLIIVNKIDLGIPESIRERIRDWQRIGIQVCEVSAKTGEGLESLARLLSGKTCAVTGQSGVGKSSLLNSLDPSLALKTADISFKY